MDHQEIKSITEQAYPPLFSSLNHDTISLQQLGFFKLLDFLQSLLATPYGTEKLAEQQFSQNIDVVKTELQKTMEMVGLLQAGYSVSLSGLSDIRPFLDKIKPQDAFLDPLELVGVKNNLQLMTDVRRFFQKYRDNAPLLQKYSSRIHEHRDIIENIEKRIDRTGEIFDNASPELRQIRLQIQALENDQKRKLAKLQKRYEEFSQDDILTLRDGRMVLGIQPNYVNKINGIVHGTSSSGATVFIEPMETLKISNDIQNLRIRERTEIIKILRFLTDLIRQVRNDIFYSIENIAILDLVLAKARLSQTLDATVPTVLDTPHLKIINGRHPLLLLKSGQEAVTPLDVEMGNAFHTLVITGPNAGGKTVAMKTVGLLVLMTQMGMLIPASGDSEIPLLRSILVDIGDRQSLEQDLSTFSAHIIRLRDIIEKADGDSLVLLDEIGTGTDPKEGSALAISVLMELTEKKVLTIATTHHGELKAFAHEFPGVENGSMEFDLETLLPTYRLRTGLPGSSYALEIARRYGLPEHLLARATQLVGEEKDKLEDLILSLEARLQTIEKERGALSIKLSQAEAMRNLYERQLDQLKANKSSLKKTAEAEAQKILQEANALIERTVREIRESAAAKSVIKNARERIREKREILQKGTEKSINGGELPRGLSKGDRVWIESLQETGELLDHPGGKRKVRVSVGNVTLTVDISGIHKTKKKIQPPKTGRSVTADQLDAPGEGVLPELDLRGLDSHDAIDETNRYLDEAIQSDWEEIRIVHGKGTGVLRTAVNNFLARDKRVESKRLGHWGEGDTGVTVVKLRKM